MITADCDRHGPDQLCGWRLRRHTCHHSTHITCSYHRSRQPVRAGRRPVQRCRCRPLGQQLRINRYHGTGNGLWGWSRHHHLYRRNGLRATYRTITINPLPAGIEGPGYVCLAGTITLADTTSGGRRMEWHRCFCNRGWNRSSDRDRHGVRSYHLYHRHRMQRT